MTESDQETPAPVSFAGGVLDPYRHVCAFVNGRDDDHPSGIFGRQAERANRQLLRSVKTLATVRRLNQPTVQVNVAEQQTNVAR
jgi:hypothetical protein